MNKMKSLIRACMSDNMSLFRIKKRDKTKTNNKTIAIVLYCVLAFVIYGYANMFMDALIPIHKEPVLLALFTFVTAILILVEGVYKSGSLLFNCKDDDLLLSLPIKKSSIVFIRILKFYVFELLYCSMFLIPTMIVYATRTSTNVGFYITSAFAIFLLPIIPIAISSFFGAIISATSTKFKKSNIAQIVVSMGVLLAVLYVSFNFEGLIGRVGDKAGMIGDTISKIYYPAAAYAKMAEYFNVTDLLIFVGIHVLSIIITILIISKIYFKINSRLKIVSKNSKKKSYKVNVSSPMVALIKKELKKFINTPVLVINAIFGMVLFLIACILIVLKFDVIVDGEFIKQLPVSLDVVKSYIPVMLLALIAFGSLTSSITSSMISLEGKFFSTLKSLPIKPYTVIKSKVYTAVLVMIPFIVIGDILFFIKFKFDIIQILLIGVSSIVIPFVAELIGIMVNLKFPELRADSDAEVVKQSSSSNVSTIIGFISVGLNIMVLAILIAVRCNVYICLGVADFLYLCILYILIRSAKTKGVNRFNRIEA